MRRFSITPRRLLPDMPPRVFRGYMVTVMINGQGVRLERRGLAAKRHAPVVWMPWEEIERVDFLGATFFRNGQIHFAAPSDLRGRASTGDGNRLALFVWRGGAYRAIRRLVTEGR